MVTTSVKQTSTVTTLRNSFTSATKPWVNKQGRPTAASTQSTLAPTQPCWTRTETGCRMDRKSNIDDGLVLPLPAGTTGHWTLHVQTMRLGTRIKMVWPTCVNINGHWFARPVFKVICSKSSGSLQNLLQHGLSQIQISSTQTVTAYPMVGKPMANVRGHHFASVSTP